ncbi:hypothetical protein DSO57_1035150 [Entomophthora muscae]|uniref:Uncharacterized protein n=1 Tax=Entomophthora muscae TaxID=34485 RepID=A0ACC2SZU5_9FUNG|nr:hypothetical protein DSO57_1035150 [Entomophthora muscae]
MPQDRADAFKKAPQQCLFLLIRWLNMKLTLCDRLEGYVKVGTCKVAPSSKVHLTPPGWLKADVFQMHGWLEGNTTGRVSLWSAMHFYGERT